MTESVGFQTRFFNYRQNNTGGSFNFDANDGISVNVIIEATDAKDADDRAKRIGLYFDGCRYGGDCSCCGDRWYPMSDGSWSDEGDETPCVYGQPVVVGGPFVKGGVFNMKWMTGNPEGFVHYMDGTVAPFGLDDE